MCASDDGVPPVLLAGKRPNARRDLNVHKKNDAQKSSKLVFHNTDYYDIHSRLIIFRGPCRNVTVLSSEPDGRRMSYACVSQSGATVQE